MQHRGELSSNPLRGLWERVVPRSADAESIVRELFELAGIQIGGTRPHDIRVRDLDLGCGWGGFASWAAEKYGCTVLGVTLSKDQVSLGNEKWKHLPVTLELKDYRDVQGTFDRVVSIGMMEHVGPKNHREMMQ